MIVRSLGRCATRRSLLTLTKLETARQMSSAVNIGAVNIQKASPSNSIEPTRHLLYSNLTLQKSFTRSFFRESCHKCQKLSSSARYVHRIVVQKSNYCIINTM